MEKLTCPKHDTKQTAGRVYEICERTQYVIIQTEMMQIAWSP